MLAISECLYVMDEMISFCWNNFPASERYPATARGQLCRADGCHGDRSRVSGATGDAQERLQPDPQRPGAQ